MSETLVYVADAAELSDEALFRQVLEAAPPERRARAERFRFRRDKQLSLAAWLLLETQLRRAGVHGYSLSAGPNGKPYIDRPGAPGFNLSHSEERVMCALSEGEVGCDVERVRKIELEIARRFFYAGEYGFIMRGADETERRERFFRLWTLKESFMKATGLGMSLALDAFEICPGEPVSVRQAVDENRWHFREFELGDGYKYAVCALGPDIAQPERISLREAAAQL